MINVLIIEDQPIYIDGITTRFQNDSEINIVDTALNEEQALSKVLRSKPDVLLLDYNLNSQSNGFELYKKIKLIYPPLKTVLLTEVTNRKLISSFIMAGIHAIRTKDSDIKELREAIVNASNGIYDHKFKTLNTKDLREEPDDINCDILRLAKEGKTYKEIAKDVCLSESSIKARIAAMSIIYDARNITHLVAMAIEDKWI